MKWEEEVWISEWFSLPNDKPVMEHCIPKVKDIRATKEGVKATIKFI